MVPAVERSFRILDLLSRSSAPMGTSEVARRLRMAKSTVHGLLRSLAAVGAGALGKVLAGDRVAVDRGEYLEGVNAVAATVPGGLVWVAGFTARLTPERLTEVAALIGRLVVAEAPT